MAAKRRWIVGIIGAAMVVIAATWAWHEVSRRWSLPFPIDAGPVIARRIESPPNTNAPGADLDGFKAIGDPVTLPADIAGELRIALSDSSTYRFPQFNCFVPHFAVSFGQGPDRVDVIICLICDRLVFFRGGEQVGHQISPAGHDRLAALYTRIFHEPLPPP